MQSVPSKNIIPESKNDTKHYHTEMDNSANSKTIQFMTQELESIEMPSSSNSKTRNSNMTNISTS